MKTYAAPSLRFMALGLLSMACVACNRSENVSAVNAPKTDATVAAAPAKTRGEKRYALTGEVLSSDLAAKTIRVKHDEVKGLMPAMTMDFEASSGDVAVVKAGQRIRADLVSTEGNFHLEKIWPDDAAANAAITAGARGLAEETHTLGNGAYREIGESIPNFTLYDQEGRVIQGGHFRGKTIMLNFIFSRCPFANMCPAATAKMMAAQKLAKEAGVKDLEFVSITLDPAYDTPGVLKEYASERGIDTTNFSFLTGPESAIRDLLAQFGVIATFEGELLKHSLATLLIDPTGKIIHRTDGSQWDPAEFIAKVKK